jgi:hypothetical protein
VIVVNTNIIALLLIAGEHIRVVKPVLREDPELLTCQPSMKMTWVT